MPDGLSFDDAATLPHSAILAIQGLRRRDGRTPGPGDRVLIGGASGNVGPFAVQLAKSYGAEVTGVCRGAKVDFVRSLGADHVIDYEMVDYATTGQRYDWIVEAMRHFERAEWLRPSGNDDARLRWNACARFLDRNPHLRPSTEDMRELEMLE